MHGNARRAAAAVLVLAAAGGCSAGPSEGGGARPAREIHERAKGGAAPPAPAPAAGLSVGYVGGDFRGRLESVVDPHAAIRDASEAPSTDTFAHIEENPFLRAAGAPLSTFSVDVDSASWSLVRRHIAGGRLPPPGAVRIEEMVNAFPYVYPGPTGEEPFAVHVEATSCPWKPEHRLVRIGLKGREVPEEERPPANLVFLVDVSGSMGPADRLPLLKQGLRLLAGRLRPVDRVAMVVYAGSSGLALPSTTGDRKEEILGALDRLEAGGSTNGGAGIRLAYATAAESFVEGGINRVLLATDGDFNVGTTGDDELVRLVQEKAKTGVFLTVLGVGTGNLKDSRLEALADRGNGNYAYLDDLAEARRVLVEEAGGTLQAIAKDVKIQVEWNPVHVAGYRLLGYENRRLENRDFADDRKDAGEIGAGHTVTALYEVVPAGLPVPAPEEPALRYQETTPAAAAAGPEMLTVRLRWKAPAGETSRLLERPFSDRGLGFADADPEFRFAASVACFGMVLRGSEHRGGASFDTVAELAAGSLGEDRAGRRHEFVALVAKARALK
jgi:Ca-activated chloride channel family protein